MTAFLAILIFLYGISIGSFLNVCIYRMPIGESVVSGSSHCTKCGNKIKAYDLIPLISFFILRGKCRDCGEKISIRYPIIELICGVLYIISFLKFGLSLEMVYCSLLSSLLLAIAVIDFENKLIPDSLLVCALIFGIIFDILRGGFLSSIIGFFTASLILYVIAIISKGGMGGGDIKMMAAFGFCIGWKNILLALLAGSVAGSIIAVYLMAFKKYDRKTEVPFGPFLAFGIYTSMLFGSEIIYWYAGLFNL